MNINDTTLFGLVWLGLAWKSQERDSKSKTFDGKSGSKLNFVLSIRDATLFGLVLVWFGLVFVGFSLGILRKKL